MVVGLAIVFIFSTPSLSVRLRSLLDASGKTIMCILIIVLRLLALDTAFGMPFLIHLDIYLVFLFYYHRVNREFYTFLLTAACARLQYTNQHIGKKCWTDRSGPCQDSFVEKLGYKILLL
jgi:hypothetical protein